MLMFLVGFIAAVLINFFGWLLLADAREPEVDEPLVRLTGSGGLSDLAKRPTY